jgi:HD superfamily phosphohydrolase
MAIRLGLEDSDRQIVRLAALLHDIGHFPLSHVGETVYRDGDVREEKEYWGSKIKDPYYPSGSKRNSPASILEGQVDMFHHERAGKEIITSDPKISEILTVKRDKDYMRAKDGKYDYSFINTEIVGAMIVGDYKVAIENGYELLVQILHSEIDADRIDYLIRDSAFTGTSYGAIDLGLLLKVFSVQQYSLPDALKAKFKKDEIDILCIKLRGVAAADQYMLSRFFSRTQVVLNRHVVALEYMVERVMHCLAPLEEDRFPSLPKPGRTQNTKLFREFIKSEKFLKFTDNTFWAALEANRPAGEYGEDVLPATMQRFVDFLLMHQEIKGVRYDKKDEKGYYIKEEVYLFSAEEAANQIEAVNKKLAGFVQSANTESLPLACGVTLTPHLPEEEFVDNILKKELAVISEKSTCSGQDPDPQMVELESKRIFRLLDGLTVAGRSPGDIHLLLDEPSSLLSKMGWVGYIVVRYYNVTQSEQAEMKELIE